MAPFAPWSRLPKGPRPKSRRVLPLSIADPRAVRQRTNGERGISRRRIMSTVRAEMLGAHVTRACRADIHDAQSNALHRPTRPAGFSGAARTVCVRVEAVLHESVRAPARGARRGRPPVSRLGLCHRAAYTGRIKRIRVTAVDTASAAAGPARGGRQAGRRRTRHARPAPRA